jgi:hypothetical protein
MRSALLLVGLLSVAVLAGCPSWLAPPVTSGLGAGEACQGSWECDDGLSCECGLCATPSEPPRPVRCIELDDSCNDPPSDCYASCGDETVVGAAACVNGRETCTDVGGVLRDQCDAAVCWGDPEPGEICVEGEYTCEFGRSPNTDDCYTFNCTGTPGSCVTSCGSTPFSQTCLGGTYSCESGMDIADCGGCVGRTPRCLRSCEDIEVLGSALCDADDLEWSCDHLLANPGTGQVSTRDDFCCVDSLTLPPGEPDAGPAPQDGGPGSEDGGPAPLDGGSIDGGVADGGASIDAGDPDGGPAADAGPEIIRCVLGALEIRDGAPVDLVLPDLERVGALSVDNTTLQSISLPALTEIEQTLVMLNNTELVSVDAPVLEKVGTLFYFVGNTSLSECDIRALRDQIAAENPILLETIEGNLVCDGGVVDAGVVPDAGPAPDAGPLDGGAADAGAADAGDADAGPDAG